MKKILYGTTALVAATLVVGPVHAAEPLKVSVSGSMQEWFAVVKNKKAGPNTAVGARDINPIAINADTEVDFKASTKLDNGLTVSAVIEVDTNDNGNNIAVDEQWASVAGGFGTVYAGVRQSTNLQLHNEAPDVGIGYGDVDIYLRHPTGGGMLSFGGGTATGAKASSDQNNLDGTSFERLMNDAPSVGYVSPQFAGFTVAGTYSSSSTSVGAVDQVSNGHNAWDLSLAYSADLGGVKIGADAGMYRMNGSQTNAVTSLQAYEGGLKIGAGGFTIGGAYMRVMEPAKRNGNAATYAADGSTWNVGASYAFGQAAVSLLYYRENHQGNPLIRGSDKFETYLLSGKYDLGAGVALKGSGFYGKYKSNEYAGDPLNNNKGYGLVTGLDLTF
ncbi:MAG: porin [Alphaproteobacteria bacterium]